MKHEQIPVYIRKLFLLIILLIAIIVLRGCVTQPSSPHPKAEGGIIELTKLQFENDIAKLDGEWEFYWNQLISPDEIDMGQITGYISVPSTWNKYITDKGILSGDGFATYRLSFITEKSERLALKIPRILTSYKLWVNGELRASAGTVGKTKDIAVPQYLPQVAFFEARQGNNEIVIQLSNFYHRSGGILESIKIGSEKQILDLRYKNIASNILLFGCLIFMGTYHLALFFYRRKNISALYFGSFCVLVGIRTLLVGECFLIYLFPGFSWQIAHKIQTLTYYSGAPLILMFFGSVFPAYFNTRISKMAQIICAAFGTLIILTPARIFTVVNPLYQAWTMIVILYIFSELIRLFIHKEKDSWLIIIGASAFLLTTINDIAFYSIWINDGELSLFRALFRIGNLSSVGLLIFAFANSLLLAKKFSTALEREEMVTVELTKVNKNLDKIVLQRTEELVESNNKNEQQKLELEEANRQLQKLLLKDPLTTLWNRRKYDEAINLEWNRCLSHQRSIALLVLDIDYFKKYNDEYGHLAGDECLTKLGQTIRNSLFRVSDIAARYGGEEFVVILPETEKEEAIRIANMLRQKIEALHILHANSTVSSYVTVSVGVTSMIPNNNLSYEDLFDFADKALYQAKKDGRNQVNYLNELTY